MGMARQAGFSPCAAAMVQVIGTKIDTKAGFTGQIKWAYAITSPNMINITTTL